MLLGSVCTELLTTIMSMFKCPCICSISEESILFNSDYFLFAALYLCMLFSILSIFTYIFIFFFPFCKCYNFEMLFCSNRNTFHPFPVVWHLINWKTLHGFALKNAPISFSRENILPFRWIRKYIKKKYISIRSYFFLVIIHPLQLNICETWEQVFIPQTSIEK